MKKISILAASLLLAGNVVANDSLESAIKAGTFSGDVTLHGEQQKNSGGNKDAGFTMGSINIGYETGDFNGFKANVGARANHDFSEKEDGDYADGTEPKSLLHTLNISYSNEFGSLTVGRQEIDLEWMSDFHEAAVLAITAIPNTTVVLGHTNRKAAADADAALEKFEDINNDKGASVLDVKYEGIENLVVNPYYYKASDLANWAGIKADFDTDMFGLTAHYAKSSEKVLNTKDGKITAFEGRTSLAGLGLSAGYVKTGKENGVGTMTAVGETPNNPFDRISGGDGNRVYEADAKTTYANVSYDLSGVVLGATYGQTEYGANKDKEKELDISAEYGFSDNLTIAGLFVDVNAQAADDDYKKYKLTLEYTF